MEIACVFLKFWELLGFWKDPEKENFLTPIEINLS